MTLLIALALWLSGLPADVLSDDVRPLFPDTCTAWEDGSVQCEPFSLPGYDEITQP